MLPGNGLGAIMSNGELMRYTAGYRNSAIVVPALLLILALFFGLLAWAITRLATDDLLIVLAGGAGATIVALITVGVTALRVHCWEIEAAGLRIDERPRFAFAGFVNSAFAPWADIVALRRIESGLVRQIEIELLGGKVHRMSQALLQDELGRRIIPDHAGLDALAAAISARLAAAGVAAAQAQEALSFWNRLPGLALLGVMFVASLAIAGAGLAAMAGGGSYYGAVMKGAAFIFLLPLGAGYVIYKSVKRRLRVRKGR